MELWPSKLYTLGALWAIIKCSQRGQNYTQTEPHIPSKEQISGHTQS